MPRTRTAGPRPPNSCVSRRTLYQQAIRVELQSRPDDSHLVAVLRRARGPRQAVEAVLRFPEVQVEAHRAGEIQELTGPAQALCRRQGTSQYCFEPSTQPWFKSIGAHLAAPRPQLLHQSNRAWGERGVQGRVQLGLQVAGEHD